MPQARIQQMERTQIPMKKNQLFLFTAVHTPVHPEVVKKLTATALAWQKSLLPSKARKTVC
jgi:hypothetical protein